MVELSEELLRCVPHITSSKKIREASLEVSALGARVIIKLPPHYQNCYIFAIKRDYYIRGLVTDSVKTAAV